MSERNTRPEDDGDLEERDLASWPGGRQEGHAGDHGADTSGGRIEKAKDARPEGSADVARSQMPNTETAAQREMSQAGADSTGGVASHEIDPFDEDTEVEG